jgi:hypothetical protein
MFYFVQCREAEMLNGRITSGEQRSCDFFMVRQVVLPAHVASLLIWRLRDADVITGHAKLRRPRNEEYEDHSNFR